MRVIDSHTEGEPTRVIVDGGPELGAGSMRERIERFASDFDDVRRHVILEPRGSDAIVGALLCEPTLEDCAAGVLFFNNRGCLGMCGHGSIGVAVTLAYLGRIGRGVAKLETPVGVVSVELVDDNTVTVENVASYRHARDVSLEVAGVGRVSGDIAWGGNWFFLVKEAPCPLDLEHERELTGAALRGTRPRTAAISSCARAAPTIARRAAPVRAPSSHASRQTDCCRPERNGCRKASSAAAFARATDSTRTDR